MAPQSWPSQEELNAFSGSSLVPGQLKILPTQYKWPVYQLVATFATTKPRGVYYRGVYLTISRTKSLHMILGIKLY